METLSGIVIACFWFAQDRLHVDMVYDHEGKPNYKTWGETEHIHRAYHWNSMAAAYKFLRENPDLQNEGYQVIDLHTLGWPRSVPGLNGQPPRD